MSSIWTTSVVDGYNVRYASGRYPQAQINGQWQELYSLGIGATPTKQQVKQHLGYLNLIRDEATQQS